MVSDSFAFIFKRKTPYAISGARGLVINTTSYTDRVPIGELEFCTCGKSLMSHLTPYISRGFNPFIYLHLTFCHRSVA